MKDEECQEKLALFLLCGVSSVITNGDNVDLRAEDIYQLCCICCKTLDVENLTTDKYKFLCSLYHIIKYLVNKVIILLYIKKSFLATNIGTVYHITHSVLPFPHTLENITRCCLLVYVTNMVTLAKLGTCRFYLNTIGI